MQPVEIEDASPAVANVTPRKYKKHVMFFTVSEESLPPICLASRSSLHKGPRLWAEPMLGVFSQKTTCSNCRHAIHTRVKFHMTWRSYVATILLSATGLCCLPMCFKIYKRGEHYCPVCNIYLGNTGSDLSWVWVNRLRLRRPR